MWIMNEKVKVKVYVGIFKLTNLKLYNSGITDKNKNIVALGSFPADHFNINNKKDNQNRFILLLT